MNLFKNHFSRHLFHVPAMAILMFLFWSCGQSAQDSAREAQLDEVKQTVEQDLKALQGDIQQRLNYLDEEIEQASGETAEELRAAREAFQQQSERLEEEIEAVKEASLEDWDEVVANVSRVATDVRSRTNEITREVRALIDEEIEE